MDGDQSGESSRVEYARSLGARLRAVRTQLGLSVHAVESLSDQEFKASALSAYERGERNVSVPRLKRLARLYDVPVDQLLPHDATAPLPGAPRRSIGDRSGRAVQAGGGHEKMTIDLTKLNSLNGPERHPLRRFLSTIQLQRHDFKGETITIRAGDLSSIACLFGVTPDAMARRLDELGVLVQSGSESTFSDDHLSPVTRNH